MPEKDMNTFDWLVIAVARLRAEVDAEPGGEVTLAPSGVKLTKTLVGEFLHQLPHDAEVTLDAGTARALVTLSAAVLGAAGIERLAKDMRVSAGANITPERLRELITEQYKALYKALYLAKAAN